MLSSSDVVRGVHMAWDGKHPYVRALSSGYSLGGIGSLLYMSTELMQQVSARWGELQSLQLVVYVGLHQFGESIMETELQ